MGLNIGEAVNFATSDWINYGQKARAIYGKTKYRIPVFPVEWVIVGNIRNLNRIKLNLDAKIAIRDAYRAIYSVEKDLRASMETSLQQQAC